MNGLWNEDAKKYEEYKEGMWMSEMKWKYEMSSMKWSYEKVS